MHTYVWVSQGVRNVNFFRNFANVLNEWYPTTVPLLLKQTLLSQGKGIEPAF